MSTHNREKRLIAWQNAHINKAVFNVDASDTPSLKLGDVLDIEDKVTGLKAKFVVVTIIPKTVEVTAERVNE